MQPPPHTAISEADVDAFIARWQNTGGKERANYQLFLTELCQLLGLPGPDRVGRSRKLRIRYATVPTVDQGLTEVTAYVSKRPI